jgi:serine phosphatase RsbU (regulator of sigma subunit)
MPGPMLLRAGECRGLKVAGISPGLFPEINDDQLTLEPGDSLLVYTDDLTDARDTQAEFEAARLQQVCRSQAEKSPLLGHIFSTIQEFMGDCPQFDDMTVAIFRCSGS